MNSSDRYKLKESINEKVNRKLNISGNLDSGIVTGRKTGIIQVDPIKRESQEPQR